LLRLRRLLFLLLLLRLLFLLLLLRLLLLLVQLQLQLRLLSAATSSRCHPTTRKYRKANALVAGRGNLVHSSHLRHLHLHATHLRHLHSTHLWHLHSTHRSLIKTPRVLEDKILWIANGAWLRCHDFLGLAAAT
jgi:hypothetical protein